MSIVPTSQNAAATESVKARFQHLASAWRAETAFVSSSNELVAHPAFQEIVGMGPAVISLLLQELENRPGHWHRALRLISGADPVPAEDRGNLEKAAEAWLRWGREQGYQW